MDISILQGLSDNERTNIPDDVANKLQERWKSCCDDVQTARAELEKLRTSNGE